MWYNTQPYDAVMACADMILADAIEDMAEEEHISWSEARERLMTSRAYDCLYDPDTGLWMEGPDYFRGFYRREECHPSLFV